MLSRTILAASLVLASLTHHALAVDVTEQPDLIAKLITADSQLDRLALLPDDAIHWHFDFTTKQNYNFAPGGVTNMNAATFPAAKGNRMTREYRPDMLAPAPVASVCTYTSYTPELTHPQWQC
jgi:hypothetical protein